MQFFSPPWAIIRWPLLVYSRLKDFRPCACAARFFSFFSFASLLLLCPRNFRLSRPTPCIPRKSSRDRMRARSTSHPPARKRRQKSRRSDRRFAARGQSSSSDRRHWRPRDWLARNGQGGRLGPLPRFAPAASMCMRKNTIYRTPGAKAPRNWTFSVRSPFPFRLFPLAFRRQLLTAGLRRRWFSLGMARKPISHAPELR